MIKKISKVTTSRANVEAANQRLRVKRALAGVLDTFTQPLSANWQHVAHVDVATAFARVNEQLAIAGIGMQCVPTESAYALFGLLETKRIASIAERIARTERERGITDGGTERVIEIQNALATLNSVLCV